LRSVFEVALTWMMRLKYFRPTRATWEAGEFKTVNTTIGMSVVRSPERRSASFRWVNTTNWEFWFDSDHDRRTDSAERDRIVSLVENVLRNDLYAEELSDAEAEPLSSDIQARHRHQKWTDHFCVEDHCSSQKRSIADSILRAICGRASKCETNVSVCEIRRFDPRSDLSGSVRRESPRVR
jgi:hypothetical protein